MATRDGPFEPYHSFLTCAVSLVHCTSAAEQVPQNAVNSENEEMANNFIANGNPRIPVIVCLVLYLGESLINVIIRAKKSSGSYELFSMPSGSNVRVTGMLGTLLVVCEGHRQCIKNECVRSFQCKDWTRRKGNAYEGCATQLEHFGPCLSILDK
jgi:hypothetical protein